MSALHLKCEAHRAHPKHQEALELLDRILWEWEPRPALVLATGYSIKTLLRWRLARSIPHTVDLEKLCAEVHRLLQ